MRDESGHKKLEPRSPGSGTIEEKAVRSRTQAAGRRTYAEFLEKESLLSLSSNAQSVFADYGAGAIRPYLAVSGDAGAINREARLDPFLPSAVPLPPLNRESARSSARVCQAMPQCENIVGLHTS